MNAVPLNMQECRQKRGPDELDEWRLEKLGLLYSLSRDDPALNRRILLHQGLFKPFYEEIYPLAVFAKHCCAGHTNTLVEWIPGSGNHDAVVRRAKEEPLYVEITQTTFAYEDRLRMEHFLHEDRKGIASLTARAKRYRKEKTGVAIGHAVEFVGAREGCRRIDSVLKSKAEKRPGHYDPNTVLVVAVDDCCHFVDRCDWTVLRDVAAGRMSSPTWPFRATFVVGMPNESFYELAHEDVFRA